MMRRKASIFARDWVRPLPYGTLLISGSLAVSGAILLFFNWPWLKHLPTR